MQGQAVSASNSQFGSKHRHFGRDAEIQAKDGNETTDLSLSYSTGLPSWSLDFGIPAEMTGLYLSSLPQTENC